MSDGAEPVQQPYVDLSRGVAPQDVGLAVAIEVADAGDLPVVPDNAERALTDDAEPVQQPDVDLSRGIAPQDVGLAVAIEVFAAENGSVDS